MSGVELKPCGISGGNNILVPLGSTTVGRGPFLGVADKRVSRNHAVLEIEDGNLRIKPIHVNPTFYAKHGESKLRPLKRGDWKELENGDRIGLTPNEHIFEAVIDVRPILSVTQSPRSSIGSASPAKSPFKLLKSDLPIKAVTDDGNTDAPSPARKKLAFPERNKNLTENKDVRNGDDEKSDGHSEDEDVLERDNHSQVSKENTADTTEKDTHIEYAKPVDRTRQLPAWMMTLSSSNDETKTSSPAAEKKTRGKTKVAGGAKRKVSDDQDEPVKPQAKKRASASTKSPRKVAAVSYEEEEDVEEEEFVPPAKKTAGRGRPRKVAAKSYKDEEDEDDIEPPPKLNRTSSRGRTTTSVSYADSWDEDDDDYEAAKDDDDDNESDWEQQSSPKKKGKGKGRTPAKGRKRRGRKSFSDEGSSDGDVYIPKPTKRTAKLLLDSQRSNEEDGSQRTSRRRRSNDSDEDESQTEKSRKRCVYGLKCYRKNKLHFKEFCHPGDDDYASESDKLDVDDEDKEDCPYGSECYRGNAEHRKKYNHKKETTNRPRRQATKGRKGDADDDGSDEDGPNTYDYEDSFLDDAKKGESQESKASTDGDRSLDVEEDSEDIGQLLKEGKDFVANKKLQQA